VFATIHSGSYIEAVARIVSAIPSEIQSSVAAQLANSLEAVVCQRLRFHRDLGIRIPECEILRTTSGVKNGIRRGEYAQITTAMEMGAENGMWTFDHYCEWVEARCDCYIPSRGPHGIAAEPSASRVSASYGGVMETGRPPLRDSPNALCDRRGVALLPAASANLVVVARTALRSNDLEVQFFFELERLRGEQVIDASAVRPSKGSETVPARSSQP
jgi:hypothetical protein